MQEDLTKDLDSITSTEDKNNQDIMGWVHIDFGHSKGGRFGSIRFLIPVKSNFQNGNGDPKAFGVNSNTVFQYKKAFLNQHPIYYIWGFVF